MPAIITACSRRVTVMGVRGAQSLAVPRSRAGSHPLLPCQRRKMSISAMSISEATKNDINNAYDIGKMLGNAGLTVPQVDALMNVIEFLRAEDKAGSQGFVTKLSHKADLAEVDLESLRRISDLRAEMSTLHHEDFRGLRSDHTIFEATMSKDLAFLKAEIALLEQRRNSTREIMEKNVEAEIEGLQSDLSKLENRVMRFSVGLIGSVGLVGLGVARLMI